MYASLRGWLLAVFWVFVFTVSVVFCGPGFALLL
jgi:hypothetical protein